MCLLLKGFHVGLDWQAHVETDAGFMRPTEIGAARGDYAKAKAELGWEPQTPFEALIKCLGCQRQFLGQ